MTHVAIYAVSQVQQGKTYYITAGAEFGDESYIWISQAAVTTNLVETVSRRFL